MKDWCTLSPDGFLGVEWAMSCWAHDGRYDAGGTLIDKAKADIGLFLDVWATATMADSPLKVSVIRAYSVLQLIGTSTLGILWWYKARIKTILGGLA